MATLAFLMNYISEAYEIEISDKFKVFINDYSSYKFTSDVYTYKFFISDVTAHLVIKHREYDPAQLKE